MTWWMWAIIAPTYLLGWVGVASYCVRDCKKDEHEHCTHTFDASLWPLMLWLMVVIGPFFLVTQGVKVTSQRLAQAESPRQRRARRKAEERALAERVAKARTARERLEQERLAADIRRLEWENDIPLLNEAKRNERVTWVEPRRKAPSPPKPDPKFFDPPRKGR
jgi:hypothetical protein